MFSSRRSRNRHSANPNPKLHTATVRRKLPDGAVLLDDRQPLGESLMGHGVPVGNDEDGDEDEEGLCVSPGRSMSPEVRVGAIIVMIIIIVCG